DPVEVTECSERAANEIGTGSRKQKVGLDNWRHIIEGTNGTSLGRLSVEDGRSGLFTGLREVGIVPRAALAFTRFDAVGTRAHLVAGHRVQQQRIQIA